MACESALSYCCLKLFVISSGGELRSKGPSGASLAESSLESITAEWSPPSSSSRRQTTSGEIFARDGRYAFIATTEAPKQTLARTASSADSSQIGELDGSGRKKVAATAPRNAKVRRRRLRWVADEIPLY